MKTIRFTKMHGAGNDYIYVDTTRESLPHPEQLAVCWSKSHTGIGSDGLICIGKSDKADFFMHMYNSDGSEGRMCGNGIRCVGKYVYDHQMTHQQDVSIETLSGVKTVHLHLSADGLVDSATVDMGQPQLEMPAQCTKSTAEGAPISIDLNGHHYEGTFVSMGNPHFVTLVPDVETAPVEALGRVIEHSPLFPEQVNVEFVQIVDRDHVKFRVWERGSGETYACGTGACAVAYTMVTQGLAGRRDSFLKVQALGGMLELNYGSDGHMMLRGPAETVYEGEMEIPDELLR